MRWTFFDSLLCVYARFRTSVLIDVFLTYPQEGRCNAFVIDTFLSSKWIDGLHKPSMGENELEYVTDSLVGSSHKSTGDFLLAVVQFQVEQGVYQPFCARERLGN